MEELYEKFGLCKLCETIDRAIEGMNLESATTFYAEFHLFEEYEAKCRLLSYFQKLDEEIIRTILHHLVVEGELEQDEDGFYRKTTGEKVLMLHNIRMLRELKRETEEFNRT